MEQANSKHWVVYVDGAIVDPPASLPLPRGPQAPGAITVLPPLANYEFVSVSRRRKREPNVHNTTQEVTYQDDEDYDHDYGEVVSTNAGGGTAVTGAGARKRREILTDSQNSTAKAKAKPKPFDLG